MAKFELVMPKMGESIIEATVLKWLKQVGEAIEQEESVLEIATDKVDSEVPSPVDGKLLEVRFNEGDVVPVGEVIAIIETEVEVNTNGHHDPVSVDAVTVVETVPYVPAPQPVEERVAVGHSNGSDRFYSPLVMNIAREEGISMQELETLSGSGRAGRVTKKDILSYVEHRTAEEIAVTEAPRAEPPQTRTVPAPTPPVTQAAPAIAAAPQIKFGHTGEYEIVEMDRMRKLIARNMVNSKHVSAHVTSFVEADVTNIVHWRNRVKDQFFRQYGEKLTFTPIFVQAVARALREHPMVNISVDGDNILIKKDINIGIAVALPSDNLIVPVIRHADRLNLAGLSAAINDLAHRARENKLRPEELEGGTYSLSNVGTFGNVMGTPIILQPQVAILATGAIRKLPAVVETPTGDVIAIRHKMFLSHSYDHRVVDGALGGRFVRRVGDLLEAWSLDQEI
jgi:2-oxoglutarate dehydrogenase E2 component (dihydrolipoamide succinyltransferase)